MGRAWAATAAALAVALLACSDDGGEETAAGDGATAMEGDGGSASDAATPADDAGGASEDAAAPEPIDGCEHAFDPGDSHQNLNPNDPRETYSYELHVPPGYDGSPTPLVLNLHGYLNNGMQQAAISRMSQVSDAEGFVVAYPNGFGSLRNWNAGDCCGFSATEMERDDVGFLDDVIEHIAGNVCVDRSRIYATGFSNGGFMAYRLACERSTTYAALGSVAGVLGIDPATCTPERIPPMLHLHGTGDLIVPYNGGVPTGFDLIFAGSTPPSFRSVADTVEAWSSIAGCGEPTVDLEMDDVRCELREGCRDGASYRMCTFQNGGHSWPGGDTQALVDALGLFAAVLGVTPTSMDASQAMWDFFSQHSL